jgi:hypothetical protein
MTRETCPSGLYKILAATIEPLALKRCSEGVLPTSRTVIKHSVQVRNETVNGGRLTALHELLCREVVSSWKKTRCQPEVLIFKGLSSTLTSRLPLACTASQSVGSSSAASEESPGWWGWMEGCSPTRRSPVQARRSASWPFCPLHCGTTMRLLRELHQAGQPNSRQIPNISRNQKTV